MTDTHDAARKALARISTIPGGNSPNGVVCTKYEHGQAIAALVEELDAKVAHLEAERAKNFDRGLQAGKDYKPVADAYARENEGLREKNKKLEARAKRANRALRIVADQATRDEIPDGYRSHVAPGMSEDWHKGYDASIAAATDVLKGGE